MTRTEMLAFLEKREMGFATTTVNKWLARGDGVAVYENVDFGHPHQGDIKLVSFGSPEAQIETVDAPTRLPDIGGDINWRYQLAGTYQGETL